MQLEDGCSPELGSSFTVWTKMKADLFLDYSLTQVCPLNWRKLTLPALIYYKALSQFPRVTIVANAINDLTVPYPTAAIVTHDPFIDHERTSLRVELEGKTIKEYYRPDPETEEVEDLVTVDQDRTSAPAPIPGLRRPSLPPVFFLPWKPFRYVGLMSVTSNSRH